MPAPSPSPIPQPKSQREPVPARELVCALQIPNSVLLRIHPSGESLTPSQCRRAPPEAHHRRISELNLPLLPLCTLPIHPSYCARCPAPQAWQCASSPDWPCHPTVNPAPRRREEKVHTSLTVVPAVGWGQTSGTDCGPSGGLGETSGLTAAPPTTTSYSRQHRGSALQFCTTPGTIQNDETEEFPSKESPGNNNS